jgi:hypothetical protein
MCIREVSDRILSADATMLCVFCLTNLLSLSMSTVIHHGV